MSIDISRLGDGRCDRRSFMRTSLKACAGIAGIGLAAALSRYSEADADTAKKPVIDAKKCTGCGKCVRMAPKTFAVNRKTRKAYVKNPKGDSIACILKATRVCRTKAITLK